MDNILIEKGEQLLENQNPIASKNIDEYREELAETIRDFIPRGTGKILFVNAPCGLGKSHVNTEKINQIFPPGTGEVAWFANLHDQFDDLGSLRSNNWVHIIGRNSGNCKHVETAKKLYNRGLPVSTTLCARCGYNSHCPYWSQFKEPGHKFFPHQHLFFFDGSKSSLVVFDELSPDVFLDKYTIDSNKLTEIVRHDKTNKSFWIDLQQLLYMKKELSGRELYVEMISQMKLQDFNTLKNKLSTLTFPDFKIDDPAQAENIPHFGIGSIITKVMLEELDALTNTPNQFNPRIHVNPISHKNGVTEHGAHVEIRIRKQPPAWIKDKPIILLGATGSADLFSHLLGVSNVETYTPKVPLPTEVEIIKVNNQMLPEITLKSKTNQDLVIAAIKQEMDTTLKTSLFTFKDLEEPLKEKLGKSIESGHFYGVRGLNSWKDSEQVIVIGTPTPNLDDIIRDVEAFYYDSDTLDKTTIDNTDFRDTRLSAYLHALREDEIHQCVFRCRPLTPNGRKTIKIIIASSIPLPEIDTNVSKNFNIDLMKEQKNKTKREKLFKAASELLKSNGSFSVKELHERYNQLSGFTQLCERSIRRLLKELVETLQLKEIKGGYGKRYGF